MNPRTLAALVAALALAAPAALAGDPPAAPPPSEKPKDSRPVSSDDAALKAIERFERDFASKDEGKRMNAILALADSKNDLVTKKLGALLSHPVVDVRQAAATVLWEQYQNPDLAGEYLRKGLLAESDDEVSYSLAFALGRLLYLKAVPDMGDVLKKTDNAYLKMEILKSFAKMKDKRALVPILEIWLLNPHGYSWQGGEEHVDTGAAGDADQKAAEAKYKAKHKNDRRRGAPPLMLKTYIQTLAETVHQITGEKLDGPMALMEWMVKHEAELGYPLPGMVRGTLKDWQEKAAKKAKDEQDKKDKR